MALNEMLLDVWLQLCSIINNDRMVQLMPFNEAFVCNLLNREREIHPSNYLTATDLCQKTGLFKSQMNTILTSLEAKKLICRVRSTQDKRKIFITLAAEEDLQLYWQEHAQIMQFIDALIERVGENDIRYFIEILKKIISCARDEMKQRSVYGN